jgi:hypothetical protein
MSNGFEKVDARQLTPGVVLLACEPEVGKPTPSTLVLSVDLDTENDLVTLCTFESEHTVKGSSRVLVKK